MEILVAVIAFAGAILSAVAAGALIRSLREDREGWLIAWSVAAIALFLALGAVGTGYLTGFGAATFKIFQLGGSLLAPLWMAVGLVQLLAEKAPPKFLAWLFGAAFTLVAGVIIVLDPILKAGDMGRSLPSGSVHWGLIPGYLLVGAHAIVALLMLVCAVIAGLRWRSGDEYDLDNLHATLVVAPTGLALLGAMRFTVPGVFTTALLVVAAAGLWYCLLRPLAPYEDDEEGEEWAGKEPVRRSERQVRQERAGQDHDERNRVTQERPLPADRPVAGHRAVPEHAGARVEAVAAVEPPRARNSGLGDLVAEYRADQQDRQAVPAALPPQGDPGPSTGYIMGAGQEQGYEQAYEQAHGIGAGRQQAHGMGAGQEQAQGRHSGVGQHAGSPTTPHRGGHTGPQHSMPGASGAELFTPGAQQGGGSGRPSPSIYGLLTVFTLMDGSGELFDRLAEQTVEAVRRGEADTLVFACHAVKSAPLQRIVYELYRDEVAYRDHQRQPHVVRFINERQSMVLATNVIELSVNAAKFMPLPTAHF
jgi:quinol monooxygenase YgiN